MKKEMANGETVIVHDEKPSVLCKSKKIDEKTGKEKVTETVTVVREEIKDGTPHTRVVLTDAGFSIVLGSVWPEKPNCILDYFIDQENQHVIAYKIMLNANNEREIKVEGIYNFGKRKILFVDPMTRKAAAEFVGMNGVTPLDEMFRKYGTSETFISEDQAPEARFGVPAPKHVKKERQLC